jgi:probable HAF family extracellular repeat protein
LTVTSIQTIAQSGGPDKEKLKKVTFELTRLGPGAAKAINARGDVVGTTTVRDGMWHAFVWTAGKGMVDLGTTGTSSEAVDINNSGQVLGTSGSSAILWTGGVSQILNPYPSSPYFSTAGMALNERGQAVLSAPTPYSHYGPMFWSPTSGFVAASVVRGYGAAINASGQVTGEINFSVPMRWDTTANVVTNLWPVMCSGAGGGWGINDAGQVAGSCGDTAFRWTDRNGYVTLPVPSDADPRSRATAINAAGWIAGVAIDKHGLMEAVLWDPSNRLVELGRPSHESFVEDVLAINDLNLVVGNYMLPGSYTLHPFLAGPDIQFIDLDVNDFQLPPVTRGNGALGRNPPFPRPLNNALQIIGTAGADAALLQPVWDEKGKSGK